MHVISYIPHFSVPDRLGASPSIVAFNLAKKLQFASVTIICNSEDYKETFEINAETGAIYRIKEGRLYRRLFRKITRLDPYPLHVRAAKIAARIFPDIFHAHQLEFPVHDFLRKLRQKTHIVVHAHVTHRTFDLKRGVADRYVAVSDYVREKLIEKNYPADKITVVRNGVDSALFAPATTREKELLKETIGISADNIVLSFVGRLQEVKGFHTFLEAARALMPKYKNLHVFVVGPEPESAARDKSYSFRNIIRADLRLRFGRRYREIPPLPHRKLANIFKVTDISFLPSLSEPQGLVMIESMSSGCITVSSKTGGIKESISNGETGFFLDKPENAGDGIQLIGDIIDHMERYESIKHNSRRFIVDNFDWKISGAKMERLYLEL